MDWCKKFCYSSAKFRGMFKGLSSRRSRQFPPEPPGRCHCPASWRHSVMPRVCLELRLGWKQRQSNLWAADREKARGREQRPTTALLAKQQTGQCECGCVATRYKWNNKTGRPGWDVRWTQETGQQFITVWKRTVQNFLNSLEVKGHKWISTDILMYPLLCFPVLTWWDLLTPASRFGGCWSRDSEPPCWSSRWGVCATAGWDWGPCQHPPLLLAHTVCRGAAETRRCSKTASHSAPGRDEESWKLKQEKIMSRLHCLARRKIYNPWITNVPMLTTYILSSFTLYKLQTCLLFVLFTTQPNLVYGIYHVHTIHITVAHYSHITRQLFLLFICIIFFIFFILHEFKSHPFLQVQQLIP